MVTTAIDPEKTVSDDHQILQADSDTKKKVTNKHHKRDSVQKEQVPDHEHRGSKMPTRSCSS